MRRAAQRASAAGVRWEAIAEATPEEALALHDRLLAVERRSWKGLQGVGAEAGPMGHRFGGFIREPAQCPLIERRLARTQ